MIQKCQGIILLSDQLYWLRIRIICFYICMLSSALTMGGWILHENDKLDTADIPDLELADKWSLIGECFHNPSGIDNSVLWSSDVSTTSTPELTIESLIQT